MGPEYSHALGLLHSIGGTVLDVIGFGRLADVGEDIWQSPYISRSISGQDNGLLPDWALRRKDRPEGKGLLDGLTLTAAQRAAKKVLNGTADEKSDSSSATRTLFSRAAQRQAKRPTTDDFMWS